VNKMKHTLWKNISVKRLSIRLAENWLYSASNFYKRYMIELPDHMIIFKEGIAYGYLNQEQFERCKKLLLSKLYSSSFFELYEKEAVKIMNSFLTYCENLAKIEFRNMNNEEVIEKWKEFLRNEDEWMSTAWLIFILDEPLSDELNDKLKKQSLMKTVLTKTKKTDMIKQRLDLLHSALTGNYHNLAEKYSHFQILNMDEEPLTTDYFLKEIRKIKNPTEEIIKIHTDFDKNLEEYEKILKDFSSDKDMITLIEACNKVAFYRDYRNDIRQKCYYHARELYFEIASRLKIDIKDVIYLERHEIESSLKEGKLFLSLEEINKRRKKSMISTINLNVNSVFDAKRIQEISEKITYDKVKEIKGACANPGKISGTAKVIVDIEKDRHKFEEGDILITTTTNLGYQDLIHKSSAIVTNIGGFLCHAAIAAREFNKPCIVNTKNATKIIKDGDLIEVDANKGVVKKIK